MNEENFSKLIENFINICDNMPSDLSRHREKLNLILNELNSIDFKYMQTTNIKRIIEDILKVFLKLPSNEDTIIIKTSHLCIQLIGKNSIPIPNHLFCRAIIFLIGFVQIHKFVGICDVLRLMHILIKNQSKNDTILLSDASGELRETIYLLLELIDDTKEMNKSNHCHYEGDSLIEVKSSSIFCLETILSLLDQIPLIAASDDLLDEVSRILIKLIYSLDINEMSRQNYCVIMRSALSSCRHIGFSNKMWCNEHVGDLIGACIVNMHFGTGHFVYEKPQKVQSSQQAVRDTQLPILNATNKGGKTVKSRKIRQMPQYKHRKSNNKPNEDDKQTKLDHSSNNHEFFFGEIAETTRTSAFITSESDTSDTETGRSNGLRDKEAKLRLAALSLLSVVGKNVDKKILFGYWHALFPSDNLTPTTISLLNCVLCDTNNRCRMTALQAASLIFYGTKSFLVQAELTDKPPTAFMPFSIVLGNQIHIMYTTLTQALANENSYAVLTQILKCLAVLIQSTTFHKMNKLSTVLCELISYIKRLVHHKDSTIQVASLIVMEFLITGNETSNDITTYLGLSKLEAETNRRIHDYGEDEVIGPEENDIDSEYEDESELLAEKTDKSVEQVKISWLLQIVLENFGVSVFKNAKLRQPSPSVQVRHQSLQVLLTMSSHFDWIKMHLKPISQALENSMNDDVATVCQRSARCMDNIAHSISNALLNQSANKNPDFDDNVNLVIDFWSQILQNITEQLQSESVEGITKSVYCDALSDIGVCVYERLSRDKQILIISLLSGLSIGDQDPLVRASAVRALAIFVLFPSLREDICFIENTTESTLKILENDLVPVRIKASWALANITDALVSQIDDKKFERISDDLLIRIFEMTKPICVGNDKVRTNVARILGNVLRLILPIHLTSTQWQLHCIDSIKLLSEQAKLSSGNSNMKVKWNACYAIGNFMKNRSIFQLETKQFNWLANIYETLNNIIVNCSNFKVRTNGTVALAIPAERSFYGEHYSSVWNACLVALYQANCFTDFNEYNHRDNLVDQLCITIAHLIVLATTNDFNVIENILMQHIDSTKQNWIRVINRMVPEKAANLLAANLHLKTILSKDKLTPDVKHSLNVILDCFVSITEYDD